MAARSSKSSASSTQFTGSERLCVIHGSEAQLITDALRQLRQATAKHAGTEVDVLNFEGESASLADVLDELRSVGLMMQHKIVIVRNAEKFVSTYRAALERYVDQPEASATLVLLPETWRPGNLGKKIDKVGRVVKCESKSRPDATKWVIERAADEYSRKMPPASAQALVMQIGTDLARLDSELAKLAVSTTHTIEVADIRVLTGRASELDPWEIQQVMLLGQPQQALDRVHELIQLASQPTELVFYFVADLVRKLHHAVGMLGDRMSDFDICRTLKIWPAERQRPFLAAARSLGRQGSADLLARLVDLDRRSKSGYGDLEANLEKFAILFCDALGYNKR